MAHAASTMQVRLHNLYQQVSNEAAASCSTPVKTCALETHPRIREPGTRGHSLPAPAGELCLAPDRMTQSPALSSQALVCNGSVPMHSQGLLHAASSRIGTVNLGSHPQFPQGPLVPTGPLPPQGPLVQGPITGMAACPRAAPCVPMAGLREAAAVPLTNRCAAPSSSAFSAGSLASFSAPAAALSPAMGQPVAAREPLPLSSAPDARAVSTEAIAGMDMIGELFQQQAKRLEVQLYQQLRDRKQIEMVNVQLQQNVQQLQQLQQQNSVQSRLIEANEQSLHVMYEQARTIHSERNTVVALCERLAADAHALRQSLAQENPRRYGHLESIPLTQVPKTRFDLPPISALFSQNANLAAQGAQAPAPMQPPVAMPPRFAPHPHLATGPAPMAVSSAAPAVDHTPAAPSLPATPSLPAELNAPAAPAVPAPAAPAARPSATTDLVPAAPPQPSGGEAAEHEVTVSEVKMDAVKVENAPPVPSAGPQQTSLALLSAVASHSSASRPNLTAKPHRGPNGSDEHSTSGSSSSGSGGRRNKQAATSFPTLDSSVSGNSGSNGSGSGSGNSGSGSNDGSDCPEDGDGSVEGDSNGSDSGNGNGDSSRDSANGEGSDSGSNGINAGSGSDHGEGSDSSNGDGGEGEGSDSGNIGSSPSAHDDGATPRKRAPRGKLAANPGASASKRRRQ